MPDRGGSGEVVANRRTGYGFVRWGLGLLLFAAAALKTHQLATQPTPGASFLDSRSFLIFWVQVEFILGIWLCSGLALRLGYVAAVACFTLFSGVTLWKALQGEASCGCFGVLEVNPWYTLILDLTALAAAIIFRPNLRVPTPPPHARRRMTAVIALVLIAGAASGFAAALYQPASLSPDGEILGNNRFVVLEPETWAGKRFPLLPHIDVADRFAKGRWTVVLYRHDCPHCQERLPQYEREAREEGLRRGITSMAMIELPPYASADESLVPADTACLTGKVSDIRDWFVETPAVITLNDGVVMGSQDGDLPLPTQVVMKTPPTLVAGAQEPQQSSTDMATAATPTMAPSTLATPADTQAKGTSEPSPPTQAAVTATSATPTDKPLTVSGNSHDFGFVEPKTTHKVLVAIPNPSEKPLLIRSVRSECKCMRATVSEKTVPAGKPIEVEVVLVAPESAVRYDQRVLLQSDDPRHPNFVVRIRADVGIPLASEPSPLDLGAAAAGEKCEGEVTIRNRGKDPIRLVYSTAAKPGCFARLPVGPVPPLGTLNIPVVVTAGGAKSQNVMLLIRTDSTLQPTVEVPIRVSVGTQTGQANGPHTQETDSLASAP
jgi:hypothetical protein